MHPQKHTALLQTHTSCRAHGYQGLHRLTPVSSSPAGPEFPDFMAFAPRLLHCFQSSVLIQTAPRLFPSSPGLSFGHRCSLA